MNRELVIDVCGQRLDLTRGDVEMLRDAAALRAGSSSRARDLALLLERSLASGQVLVLRRGEAHALHDLASEIGIARLAGLAMPASKH